MSAVLRISKGAGEWVVSRTDILRLCWVLLVRVFGLVVNEMRGATATSSQILKIPPRVRQYFIVFSHTSLLLDSYCSPRNSTNDNLFSDIIRLREVLQVAAQFPRSAALWQGIAVGLLTPIVNMSDSIRFSEVAHARHRFRIILTVIFIYMFSFPLNRRFVPLKDVRITGNFDVTILETGELIHSKKKQGKGRAESARERAVIVERIQDTLSSLA